MISQQTKEAFGKLLNRVGGKCMPIVAAHGCNKSIEQNTEILNDSFKVNQLRDVARGSIHLSLVGKCAFINKKTYTTNHSDFIYPCQAYSFQGTNHVMNPAFNWNMF